MPTALVKPGASAATSLAADSTYTWGAMSHDVSVTDGVSPDAVVVHLSKMAGAHLKLASRDKAWSAPLVPRSVKDRVLRGT